MGSLKKCNLTRSTNIGDLKMLIIESTEAHRRHTENNEELHSKCLRLEKELEFASSNLVQLPSTVQLLAIETDRAGKNVLELARCLGT